MRNGKAQAVKAVLAKHGIKIDTDVALEVVAAASTRKSAEYEPGDFVELYGGMGNVYWGEVVSKNGRGGYTIRMWDEAEEKFTHTTDGQEISKLSTKEEAREYYLAMTRQNP